MQRQAAVADIVIMARLPICVTGLVLTSAILFAQAPNGGGPGPVLGIVELPEMFSIDPITGESAPRRELVLYTRPDSERKVAARISSPTTVDDAEYGYEEAGALVYGRKNGYFLIRTSRGVGWVSPDNVGEFHSFETLIKNGLAYLTDAWDGFVSASPASANRTRVTQRRPYGYEDVRVKGLQNVAGKLWVEVEVISHSICESNQAPTLKGNGWVLAHDKSGAPTVWFASRGC